MANGSKTKNPQNAVLEKLFGPGVLDLIGDRITGEEIEYHNSPKIIIPKGMTYDKLYEIIERLQQEAETPTMFEKKFLFRANDGAHATFHVIKERYGMLLGKPQMTFFGLKPAETRTIAIGVGETLQVPWGLIEIPIFDGLSIRLTEVVDDDFGAVFQMIAQGPRKHKEEMDALFKAVEEFLKDNSIYRGRAIAGSANPEFLDLASFDPSKVIFSDEATATLEGLLHAPIRFSDAMRREGVPLKRSALLEGPFGTGKTSEGMILAGIAVDNGWTFISARPGKDKVDDVLRTARLYQPAVVFVEDIDGETNSGEDVDVTKFLDAFDGVTSKNGEIIAVMTTNHVERIHKGMLRPGRLDAVVHIGSLDRNGIERLIRAVVAPTKLSEHVDYDEVASNMTGFYPAFVKESVNRAVTVAIGRLQGKTDYVIETSDLVTAAISLHAQLEQLEGAGEGVRSPGVDGELTKLVRGVLLGTEVDASGEFGAKFPVVEAPKK